MLFRVGRDVDTQSHGERALLRRFADSVLELTVRAKPVRKMRSPVHHVERPRLKRGQRVGEPPTVASSTYPVNACPKVARSCINGYSVSRNRSSKLLRIEAAPSS